ncbi:MAG: 2-oxoglutarate dehydrogenase complex dihydrolipoyllysine-residue succinyltransferase [Deltaproteobacteria bacterium]|nr:2-oxoglutarate dehydrogenase complex dihydrolipoyllysine-residue succinyltransferase [Deltaproteobacteria bacterium]
MAVDISIPALGESITEATVLRWLKAVGEPVALDEIVVEIETDKATMELAAPEAGVLSEILKGEGEKVEIGDVIGRVSAGVGATKAAPPQAVAPAVSVTTAPLSPAVRRLVDEHSLHPAEVTASGRGGRLTKGDVVQHLEERAHATATPKPLPAPSLLVATSPTPMAAPASQETAARERREPMSRIRRRIAERLKQVQNTAAILTTFNEIDMTAALELRAKYNEAFKQKYGASFGFMSLFAKASVEALRTFPAINAEIRGEEIVYKNYYDLGIAVSTEHGLIVPVIREVDGKSMAEIEIALSDLGQRARTGKIRVEELQGGTFSITNGGVFGSLMSTPILNPPQSGILGMHKIEKRPVVVSPSDQIVVRSMMYVALSYDHRIVDGREAVLFLRRIKDCIEDPARLLLGL